MTQTPAFQIISVKVKQMHLKHFRRSHRYLRKVDCSTHISLRNRLQQNKGTSHRHLSNIDYLTAHTACLVCFISTVNDRSKKIKRSLGRQALVAGT